MLLKAVRLTKSLSVQISRSDPKSYWWRGREVRRERKAMSFQERVQVQTWQRLERSSYGWERQQLRQQTNDTGQREHTDCLKFRIGGRSRSIPAVQRFNQRIRKRK